jgi:hypothetical protein
MRAARLQTELIARTCGILAASRSVLKPRLVNGETSARRRAVENNAIPGVRKTEHFPGDLLDKIRIRQIRPEERDVALEFGTHGLEALYLELQSAFALEQPVSSLETVAAFQCVIGEIAR